MPPNYRQGEPLSRRERRGVALLAALMLLAGTGVGIWEVAKPRPAGSTGRCVSVVVASATGGAEITHCGRSASAWCSLEATRDDAIAVLARPACRKAGLPS